LKEFIADQTQWTHYLEIFSSAIEVTFFNRMFFVLTRDRFLMFSETQIEEKVLVNDVEEGDDVGRVMLENMGQYTV